MAQAAAPEVGRYGPIEVFRAGDFRDMTGGSHSISESDLHQIAASYDKDMSPAPVVIGHPETDAPAYGWIDRLYVEGGKMKAMLHDTVAEFADWVKAGRYRRVSLAFFPAGHSANPKPGALYVKHVGFLGAVPPAVSGLKPVSFSDTGQGGIILFQDRPDAMSGLVPGDRQAETRRNLRNYDRVVHPCPWTRHGMRSNSAGIISEPESGAAAWPIPSTWMKKKSTA